MGEPSDDSSYLDRIKSWAKTHASTSTSEKTASILPVSTATRNGANRTSRSTNNRPGPGHQRENDGSSSAARTIVAAGASSNTHAVAPPPVDSAVEGGASTTVEGEKQKEKRNIITRTKDGSKRFFKHTKDALLHSWINVLLVFVPIGIAVKAAGLSPEIVFAMNAIAVIPLAGLLSYATESVASRLGDTLGALLNVSFGNAVELIIL